LSNSVQAYCCRIGVNWNGSISIRSRRIVRTGIKIDIFEKSKIPNYSWQKVKDLRDAKLISENITSLGWMPWVLQVKLFSIRDFKHKNFYSFSKKSEHTIKRLTKQTFCSIRC
jgi:hypothetical protein